MVTEVLFCGVVALVGVQRACEVAVSRRNERRLRARGGREHAPGHMTWMVAVHAGWLAAMPLEVLALGRPFSWPLALAAGAVFATGQGLRYAAIRGLGPRWTVRVMTVPGEAVVTRGVFRWLRHPNYLGVILEIAALPLVHGAWITSAAFTAANGLVLRRRIHIEEGALAADTDYARALGDR